jgi:hypothetical protein
MPQWHQVVLHELHFREFVNERTILGRVAFGQGRRLGKHTPPSKLSWDDEGATLSRLPIASGVNAVAGMHDEWMCHMGGFWRNFLNFPLCRRRQCSHSLLCLE